MTIFETINCNINVTNMVQSRLLYNDTHLSGACFNKLLAGLSSYAEKQNSDVYLLRFPKTDTDTSMMENKGCFLLLTADHKICIINGGASDEEFEYFYDDVNETFLYLFKKHEYREVFGRYGKWIEGLMTKKRLCDIENVETLINDLTIDDAQTKKYVNLLIALAIGSINDIHRVGSEIPEERLDKIKKRILLFDADQTRFVYTPLSKKIIRIQGLSGTGKTELLLHKLKVLYTDKNRYRIFVTCHNKVLADTLYKRIPDFFNFMKVNQQIEWNERLWCTNAWGRNNDENSGLYSYICWAYDIPYEPFIKGVNNFSTVCKHALQHLKIKEKNSGKLQPILDYILIDESQDFDQNFIDLCSKVVSKQIYVAGDVFQSIFSTPDRKVYEAEYFLKKCYRTSPQTLMFAHALGLGLFEKKRFRWLAQEDWEACGYTCSDNTEKLVLSRKPFKRFNDDDDNYPAVVIKLYENSAVSGLVSLIKEIIKDNPTAKADDFAIILLDDDKYIYEWADMMEMRINMELDWIVNKTYETKSLIPNTVSISNRNNVKGLEFPFIICITKDLQNNYAYRNSIYTMLTRSFLQSFLIVSKDNSGVTKEILLGLKEIVDSKKMTIRIPHKEEMKDIETRFSGAKTAMTLHEIVEEYLTELNVDKTKWDSILKITQEAIKNIEDKEVVRDKIKKIVLFVE